MSELPSKFHHNTNTNPINKTKPALIFVSEINQLVSLTTCPKVTLRGSLCQSEVSAGNRVSLNNVVFRKIINAESSNTDLE